MFTLSRTAFAEHSQAIFTVAEAALASLIVFGAGLALGVTVGFF